jgi:hypothetical protein
VLKGGAVHVWGQGVIRTLYLPLNFAVNLKLLLKIRMILNEFTNYRAKSLDFKALCPA